MEKSITLSEIVELTKQLSLVDKVRLIEEIAPQIEQELKSAPQTKPAKRTPLRGLCKGLEITEQDIADARSEMWDDFPRKDI